MHRKMKPVFSLSLQIIVLEREGQKFNVGVILQVFVGFITLFDFGFIGSGNVEVENGIIGRELPYRSRTRMKPCYLFSE